MKPESDRTSPSRALPMVLDPDWTILKQHLPKEAPTEGHRLSAVLIPILDVPGYPILFTQRSHDLKHHAGQLSFPGGVVEKGETPWEAACREADEEVGLPPEKVHFLGQLDDVFSPRGFHIKCLAGLVQPFQAHLNLQEVSRIITVPLSEIFEPCYHKELAWKNRTIHFFHFPSGLVWGVTGKITAILKNTLLKTSNRSGWA